MTATAPPAATSLQCQDVLTLTQLAPGEINAILTTALNIKGDPGSVRSALAGRAMAMLFEKPSLRTRVSFEVGMAKLGGTAVYLDHQRDRLGVRESVSDYGRNLERWVDVIVARTFEHSTLVGLSESTTIPVVNALSDKYHPCQALADMLTLKEHFDRLPGLKLAYVGDGNNVCHSLLLAAGKLGVHMTAVTPAGYEPNDDVVHMARLAASSSHATIDITNDLAAVEGHDAVYTDTWVSMGQEEEHASRHATLLPYQVTPNVMASAAPGAIFMHCLPAHRGHEVTAAVIDSPASVVFDQAENRMHAQNALLLHLLGNAEMRNKK